MKKAATCTLMCFSASFSVGALAIVVLCVVRCMANQEIMVGGGDEDI